jgi:hypothetical protein
MNHAEIKKNIVIIGGIFQKYGFGLEEKYIHAISSVNSVMAKDDLLRSFYRKMSWRILCEENHSPEKEELLMDDLRGLFLDVTNTYHG